MKRLLIMLLTGMLHTGIAVGQQAQVSANKYRIRIGDQSNVLLQAKLPQGQTVRWPLVPDSLGPHFDVISQGPIDTLPDTSSGGVRIQQLLTVTSFDTGRWRMPVFDFTFIQGADSHSVVPEALVFEVEAVPVDTTQAIKDIRPIVDVPFDIGAYIPWVLAGLAALAIVIAGIYLWLNRKKQGLPSGKPVKLIPAWERAFAQLEELEREQRWQNGDQKGYHSRISEIIRAFIEEQFSLPALESTTEEITGMLKRAGTAEEQLQRLQQMLTLADLVKFAKQEPSPAEHIRSLNLAREFVQAARPVAAVESLPGKEDGNG